MLHIGIVSKRLHGSGIQAVFFCKPTSIDLIFNAAVLGGRKGIRPVKTECWGNGVVVCLGQGAYLHMAQLMPLPLTYVLLQ